MKPTFSPILGAGIKKDMSHDEFFSFVIYPVIATPKFDGIRCTTIPGELTKGDTCRVVCRSLEDVPNLWIRRHLAKLPPGLDGEIMTYDPGDLLDRSDKPRKFHRIQSDVISEQGMPLFKFHVFDHYDFKLDYPWLEPYVERLAKLDKMELPGFCIPVTRKQCHTRAEIETFEEACLRGGYEGICWRWFMSPYKHARSTLKQQWLIKMKRFEDAEATIIGWYEEMQNNNPQATNALGYTERSSHKANMKGKGRLGGFVARCQLFELDFHVGSGFDAAQRELYWEQRETLVNQGAKFKFKYQPHGTKDRPRSPIFLGLRDKRDL